MKFCLSLQMNKAAFANVFKDLLEILSLNVRSRKIGLRCTASEVRHIWMPDFVSPSQQTLSWPESRNPSCSDSHLGRMITARFNPHHRNESW